MEIVYQNKKVEKQCTGLKEAKKLFGGSEALALSLLARINAIEKAETIKDIVVQKQFSFHNLHNVGKQKLDGYFAIDVKTRKDPWRIILRPLNNEREPFIPCNIDEIAEAVEIVEIKEVSKHYE
ncbi:hypothetical protein [Butyrivibrio sp. AD3002]|uniref:hypothetical protein n=1 Tax=Butyrivibrio sp. AD3002 TaxID=1280670 RepID=UPI0003B685C2|nr:hypothetical protein [Butyrivibrio sp. AD3002]